MEKIAIARVGFVCYGKPKGFLKFGNSPAGQLPAGRKRWHWPKEVSVTSGVITINYCDVDGYGGYANGSSMNNTDTNGNYWSSTENDSSNAYNLNYNSGNLNVNNNNKYNGRQVRCVK
jgi:uncharacterized protein (TIGR02145 family)